MSKEKQYGLILPKSKTDQAKPKVASVFNDSSTDDEDTNAVVSGRAENDPEGSHGKITTRVITPVY